VFTPDTWSERGIPLDYLWTAILTEQRKFDLRGKDVLDVGCRDGLFSFAAEQQGARRVLGVDNDLSKGATELLIPYFRSKVELRELNLYEVERNLLGTFEAIFLYGLRKLVDVLEDGGILLIESGMVADARYDHLPIIYCPVDDSPYRPDWTSCTFFTEKGLAVTLESLGMVLDHSVILERVAAAPRPRLRDGSSPTTIRPRLRAASSWHFTKTAPSRSRESTGMPGTNSTPPGSAPESTARFTGATMRQLRRGTARGTRPRTPGRRP
jgi:SAM-dependent methyltransferase